MKIEFIDLEGKKYPLSFSLLVTEEIMKKYKSTDNLMYLLKDKKAPLNEKMDAVTTILSNMIYSGCEYYNSFHKQPYKNAPVRNGKFIPLSNEQIKIAIDPMDGSFKDIIETIKRCISSSSQRKIGTKPKKTKSKKKKKN